MRKQTATILAPAQLPPHDLYLVEIKKRRDERRIRSRVDEFCWVKGLSSGKDAAGIAIVNGKLTRVVIWAGEETMTKEVTLAEAAKYLRQLLQTESDLRMNVEYSDEGETEFLKRVEAAGNKN